MIETKKALYLSTSESISFTNWQNNRPDNHNDNEDCGEFGRGRPWNDLPCDNKQKFVCEKKLIK